VGYSPNCTLVQGYRVSQPFPIRRVVYNPITPGPMYNRRSDDFHLHLRSQRMRQVQRSADPWRDRSQQTCGALGKPWGCFKGASCLMYLVGNLYRPVHRRLVSPKGSDCKGSLPHYYDDFLVLLFLI